MNVNKYKNGTELKVEVEGRLDTVTAPELESTVKSDISDISKLTFDFSKLEYISSAGLRVLLSFQKIMTKHGEMTLTGCSENIMEIFDVTGFTDILTIV